jgi:hypothetical protein
MHADPGSLRERLKSSAEAAWRLYCAIETVIPHKQTQYGQPSSRQKLTVSTIPWHTSAANVSTDFHAEIRRLEINMSAMVTGVHGVRRGGSHLNTQYALKGIVNLSEGVDDQAVMGVLNYLDRWVRRAEAIFSPDRGLHQLPREPGEAELRCPYCAFQTMRWQPATGIIVCINPECHTDQGIRPRWIASYELTDNEMRFTWAPMDGGET